jgi:hypothetical protein
MMSFKGNDDVEGEKGSEKEREKKAYLTSFDKDQLVD